MPAGFACFMSALIQSVTLNEATGSVVTVPWYWVFLGGIVFLAVMSLFDIRISTRSQLVFTVLSVAVMLLARQPGAVRHLGVMPVLRAGGAHVVSRTFFAIGREGVPRSRTWPRWARRW
ncbi:MAG: hypothetical protein ACRD0A_13285 [Acidimicrobiales bacterium]